MTVHLRGQVKVYDAAGVTLLATLNEAYTRGLGCRLGINRTEPFQLQVRSDEPTLLADPDLFDHFNVVKVGLDIGSGYVERAGFQIRHVEHQNVSMDADGGPYWITVSGPSLEALLDGVGVLPQNGLGERSGDLRWFNGGSVEYDDTGWGTVLAAGGLVPPGIVELDPAATAIWPVAQAVDHNTDYKEAWFRGTLTIPGTDLVSVTIAATADDFFELYVDGELVLSQTSQVFQWRNTFTYEMTMEPGSHLIAAKVWDAYHTSWFVCTVVERDADGEVVSVIHRTNTGWIGQLVEPAANPAAAPVGWTAGEIVLQILNENSTLAASLTQTSPADLLTPTFTATLDSNGVAWAELLDRSFPIGTDLLDVLTQLAEDGVDFHVTPDMELHLIQDRGSDLTASVEFLPEVNLLEHTVVSDAARKTLLQVENRVEQVQSQDAINTLTLVGYLALGNTSSRSQTYRLAERVLEALSTTTRSLTSKVLLVAGAVPFVDFDLGDEVTTVDETGAEVGVVCVSHTFAENENGLLDYVPEWLL